MHGTYVNGRELQRKEPKTLHNGDVIIFGAEVRRGVDTFAACAFRVNYDFFQEKQVSPLHLQFIHCH